MTLDRTQAAFLTSICMLIDVVNSGQSLLAKTGSGMAACKHYCSDCRYLAAPATGAGSSFGEITLRQFPGKIQSPLKHPRLRLKFRKSFDPGIRVTSVIDLPGLHDDAVFDRESP